MKLVSRIARTAILLPFLFTGVAQADVLGIAGVSAGDDSTYAYVGGVIPTNGDLSKDGYLIRLWAFGQEFEYERTTLSDVDADGGGFEIAIGHQWKRQDTDFTVYLGLVDRNLDTSPEDPLSKADGHSTGVKLQVELTHELTSQWNFNGMASYVGGDDFDDSWLRLRAGHKWKGNMRVGPELTHVNGPDYDNTRLGAYVSGIALGSVNLDLSGGAEEHGGYIGVSFSKVF